MGQYKDIIVGSMLALAMLGLVRFTTGKNAGT